MNPGIVRMVFSTGGLYQPFPGTGSEILQCPSPASSGDCDVQLLDCSDLTGTKCYCEAESAEEIRRRIQGYGCGGIHFIDTGDYHYLTQLWTEKIDRPFSLLLFDHHPDIQPPVFEGMISCGGWVREMLLSDANLKKVYMIGVADSLMAETENFAGRVEAVSEDTAFVLEPKAIVSRLGLCPSHHYGSEGENGSEGEGYNGSEGEGKGYGCGRASCGMLPGGEPPLPLYISIDKDVLCRCCAVTNWDQGTMTTDKLLDILKLVCSCNTVLGVDICGGSGNCANIEAEINLQTDRKLLDFFSASTLFFR